MKRWRCATAAVVGGLLAASLAQADIKTTVYQDIHAVGSSRVAWTFNWHYAAENTSPTPTCACDGRSNGAMNFIGPSFTSPAASPWINSNGRQTATRGFLAALSNNCVPAAGYVKFSGENTFDHVIQSVGVTTDIDGIITCTSVSLAIGNVQAGGGLSTTALSDTVHARDSVRVRISKNPRTGAVPGTLTLNNFAGEIRNNTGPGLLNVTNTFIVAVYPDSDVANADVTSSGFNALFHGRVYVTQTGTTFAGGFTAADFNIVTNPDGSIVVTPQPGLTKAVSVPNVQAAVVVVVADPRPSRPAGNVTRIHKVVPIDSSQEPTLPVPSTATGQAQITIDTFANTLAYNISYSGLTSTETAAHIHGFAPRGVNVGVLHGLPAGNPKIGTWTYTEAQEANILAGQIYINIHTSNNPGGEIRGQIDQAGTLPASTPVGAIALATALLCAGAAWMVARRRREAT